MTARTHRPSPQPARAYRQAFPAPSGELPAQPGEGVLRGAPRRLANPSRRPVLDDRPSARAAGSPGVWLDDFLSIRPPASLLVHREPPLSLTRQLPQGRRQSAPFRTESMGSRCTWRRAAASRTGAEISGSTPQTAPLGELPAKPGEGVLRERPAPARQSGSAPGSTTARASTRPPTSGAATARASRRQPERTGSTSPGPSDAPPACRLTEHPLCRCATSPPREKECGATARSTNTALSAHAHQPSTPPARAHRLSAFPAPSGEFPAQPGEGVLRDGPHCLANPSRRPVLDDRPSKRYGSPSASLVDRCRQRAVSPNTPSVAARHLPRGRRENAASRIGSAVSRGTAQTAPSGELPAQPGEGVLRAAPHRLANSPEHPARTARRSRRAARPRAAAPRTP
jgi:hypothetical protein